jgi:hypothetical protein
MKIFYLSANIFLFFAFAVLLYLNVVFKNSQPDPVLQKTPDVSALAKISSAKQAPSIRDFSAIWEDNVFSQYRMKDGGEVFSGIKAAGIELMGVCIYGELSGAIIFDKTAPVLAAGAPTAGTGTPTPARPGQSKNLAGKQGNLPKFYKKGETLDNGFELSEINADSVVLSRGREQIILQLEYSDEGSISRTENNISPPKPPPEEEAKKTPDKPHIPSPERPMPKMQDDKAGEKIEIK